MSAEVVKFEKEEEKKPVDNLYRLEEMAESMSQSLSNVENVIGEQTELLEIIKNSGTKVDFTKFIEATESQKQQLIQQHSVLSSRQKTLIEVINLAKENEVAKDAINALVDALGIFA